MKKWLTGLFVIVLILIGSVYIFIPATLKISDAGYIYSTINGVNRYLLDGNNWARWWRYDDSIHHRNSENESGSFTYNGYRYEISKHIYNGLELGIIQNSLKVNSAIHVMNISKDSIAVFWNAAFTTSRNPVKRIQQYKQAKTIKANMGAILRNLKSFSEKTVNIYGFHITEIMSKDSALITTTSISDSYPAISEIYGLINNLKAYAESQGAKEINYPMLNVRKDTGGHFNTMVAISLNKRLEARGKILPKRFVPWKTLTAEVIGGPHSIMKGYDEMKIYTQDNHRESMALPFESMVTDRRIQKDTSKWVTLICQPVS